MRTLFIIILLHLGLPGYGQADKMHSGSDGGKIPKKDYLEVLTNTEWVTNDTSFYRKEIILRNAKVTSFDLASNYLLLYFEPGDTVHLEFDIDEDANLRYDLSGKFLRIWAQKVFKYKIKSVTKDKIVLKRIE